MADGDMRPFNGKTLVVYLLSATGALSGGGASVYTVYRDDQLREQVQTAVKDQATTDQRVVALERNEVPGLEVRLNRVEAENQSRAQLFADVGELKATLTAVQKQVEKMDAKLEKVLEAKQ